MAISMRRTMVAGEGPTAAQPLSAAENRKIERGRLAQPRCVGGVILEVITGDAMDQDVQSLAVSLEPRNQLIELGRVERELTAPVRMGSNELLMESAHRNAEQRRGRFAQLACLLRRLLVEVDVGVILRKHISGSGSHRMAPERS